MKKTPHGEIKITPDDFALARELSAARKDLPGREPIFGTHEFPLLAERVQDLAGMASLNILPGVSATPGFVGRPEVVESYNVPADLTPLNRPVHVRIERRGDQVIYCSIFLPTLQDLARILVDYASRGESVPQVLGEPDVLFRIETDVTRASA